MIVTLSPQDAAFPAHVGMRRQIFALSQRLRNHYDLPDDANCFDIHIFGAMAEFALARALNLFWEPHIAIDDKPDVGGVLDVRLRRLPGTGSDLPIKPKDHD